LFVQFCSYLMKQIHILICHYILFTISYYPSPNPNPSPNPTLLFPILPFPILQQSTLPYSQIPYSPYPIPPDPIPIIWIANYRTLRRCNYP